MAKSYAVGGTGRRDNEEVDNAKYYYGQCVTLEEITRNSKNSAETAQSKAEEAQSSSETAQQEAEKAQRKVEQIADNLNTIITDNDGNVISLAELVARFNKLEAEIGNINIILDSINGEVI
jgi:methyl-accepting chemotaxis protein